MSKTKNLKTILIVLLIVLVSMISFGGIYVKNKGSIENNIPEYKLAKDLKGYRRVELNLNSQEEKSEEDFKTAKRIIETRLEKLNAYDYEIRQNLENGTIVFELAENDDTDKLVSYLNMQSKFEIKDNDTNEVLMTNDDLETARAGYGTDNSGDNVVFLELKFNKEGTEKLKEISNIYRENKTSEENDTESSQKQIAITLDGNTLRTTYFAEELTNGVMQLPVNSSKYADEKGLEESFIEINEIAQIIESGKLPVEYEIGQNQFILSDISKADINNFVIVAIILVAIAIIYLIVKYKKNGILAGIALIGYVATLLLVIRYANVEVSVSGLVTIIFSIILNYFVTCSIAKKANVMESLKKYWLLYVPVLIVSVVFTLANITMGAMLFWGIVIIFLYNLVITKFLMK